MKIVRSCFGRSISDHGLENYKIEGPISSVSKIFTLVNFNIVLFLDFIPLC